MSPCSAYAEVNSWRARGTQGQDQSLPAHQGFSNCQNSMTNLFGATKCQNWVLSFKDNCQGDETVWTQKSYYRHNCSKVCRRPCKAKTSTGGWANIMSSNKGTTTHSALWWIPFRAPGLQAAKINFSKQMPAVCLSVKAPANFNKHLGAHFLCPWWFLPGGWSGTCFPVFHTWRDNTWMSLWPSCYTNTPATAY